MTRSDPMQSNPSRPENIPPPIEPVGFLTGIQLRPILIGSIVDYVATFLLSSLYLMAHFARETVEKGRVSEEDVEKFLNSTEALIILAVIGVLCTVLGGYVAGRLAKRAEVKHGALVGVGSIILVKLTEVMLGETGPVPLWYEVASYVVAIPVAALGGYLSQRQRELRAS